MDEATQIGQPMAGTESIHAWSGEDVSWMQPTGQWPSRWGTWVRHLKNVALYSLPAAAVAVSVMMVTNQAAERRAAEAPPIVKVTPTAPPVPNAMQTPPDPYYTQVASPQEFLDSLTSNDMPVPDDAVKEAHDICRLLEGGMPFHQAVQWTFANHPGWKSFQVGFFTGASTGFCPKYSPN